MSVNAYLNILAALRFRIDSNRIRLTLTKLKLLELGEFGKCSELDNLMFDSNSSEDISSPRSSTNDVLGKYDRLFEKHLDCGQTTSFDSLVVKTQREVLDHFNKEAMSCSRCDTCGSFSPALRKDGMSKIFERPLQRRLRKSMSGMKFALKVKIRETF